MWIKLIAGGLKTPRYYCKVVVIPAAGRRGDWAPTVGNLRPFP